MASIVDQILNDPCATISESDAEELRKLDPGILKRLVLGLQTQDQPVINEENSDDDDASEITELKEALESTQKHLRELLSTEKDIRTALSDYGVQTSPVIERSVSVANQKNSTGGELTPKAVMDFVKYSQSPTAMMLREGLFAARESRKKSVEVIVANTAEYTEHDLQRMPTADLVKLARILSTKAQQNAQDPLSLSWEGLGLADQSINQTPAIRGGGVLDLSPGTMGPPTNY